MRAISSWLPATLTVPALVWLYAVNSVVPNPYLDEFFHVRQAQHYLQGRWHAWDPKITTPPGLYFITYISFSLCRFLGLNPTITASSLRTLNTVLVYPYLALVIGRIGNRLGHKQSLGHAVLNITSFPLLFFFSGLYYTDIASALVVLLTYDAFLHKRRSAVFLIGTASLWFRQTNIFWVSIFVGGLDAVRCFPKVALGDDRVELASAVDVLHQSYIKGQIYDWPVEEATIEHYFLSGFSLLGAFLSDPWRVVTALRPYLAILLLFAGFVIWNGGVVLGDKENHIASLHLAQMLYIWPYFLFFSWPLLYQRAITMGIDLLRSLKQQPCLSHYGILRSFFGLAAMGLMALIVRYNTIIHPFTLADNRHYMFYVFRILLHHPLIKYAVIPIYFSGAILCISALGRMPYSTTTNVKQHPPLENSALSRRDNGKHGIPSKQPTDGKTNNNNNNNDDDDGNGTAFTLILILATSLSLITAPLVEPRYFILPWLLWRLHLLPQNSSSSSPFPNSLEKKKRQKQAAPSNSTPQPPPNHKAATVLQHLLQNPTFPLYLETIWFLLVNFTTCYIFLRWGFEWKQEVGSVQRFMW